MSLSKNDNCPFDKRLFIRYNLDSVASLHLHWYKERAIEDLSELRSIHWMCFNP
jgi:hypothetical protein